VPQVAPAYPVLQTQAAVPVASEQVPWPLHASSAVAQSGEHIPLASLSWYPEAQTEQSAVE